MSTTSDRTAPSKLRALVVYRGELSSDDRNAVKLLDFFGVPRGTATVDEIVSTIASADSDCDQCCILGSATAVGEVIRALGSPPGSASRLGKVRSVHVYGFQDTPASRGLLKQLMNGNGSDKRVRPLAPLSTVSIAGSFPEMCGPMSGLQVQIGPTHTGQLFDVRNHREHFQPIISAEDGAIFARVEWQGTPFFLNACSEIIDIDSPSPEFFDVRQFFSSAVPVAMYIKWAFKDVCWQSPEISACLIVDDPLLKARYGFLHFQRALELMDEHRFTMSLAFIPWNWRRTDRNIVKLFRERADRLSVSVHGCDHTSHEFASQSPTELNARTKKASERMNRLSQQTSLQHDRIMVFPQGQFSAEVGEVLKLNGFLAAVNTEVAPSRKCGNRATTVRDVWGIAINRYGSFPIFTRRYITHGIENFAFDMLLGKPCFLVAHHDGFKEDGRALVEFVDRLHSLHGRLVWRSLGDAVGHSVRIRRQADGSYIAQMYGSHVSVSNSACEPLTLYIIKEESDPTCVQAVTVNNAKVKWDSEGPYLRFAASIPPKGAGEVSISYVDRLGDGHYPTTMGYKVKTGVRRILSEARDQYASQSSLLTRGANTLKELLG